MKPTACRLCHKPVLQLFQALILHKYHVQYYLCEHCGLIQTEKPYWIREAYQSPIIAADTGLLSRNLDLSRFTASLIFFLFNPKKKYLDFAGGYGVFTRLMRDIGFDYYWDDKYSDNYFARGFTHQENQTSDYELVTAFEFFEHAESPLESIQTIFDQYRSRSLVFSTLLYQGDPPPENWWYYAFAGGQHISIYSLKTLQYLAEQLDFYLYSDGASKHLLTQNRISTSKYRIITRYYRQLWLAPQCLMKSKTFSDHQQMISKTI
jgi:hypothetical protein